MREIRRDVPDAVTILLTAYERFDIAKEAFELGVFDYLIKPVNQDKLLAAIRSALEEIVDRKNRTAEAFAFKDELRRLRPLLEEAFCLAVAMGGGDAQRIGRFASLLGLDAPFILAIALQDRAGSDAIGAGKSANGAGGSANTSGRPGGQEEFRAWLSDAFSYRMECVVGPSIFSRIPVFIPLKREEDADDVMASVRQILDSKEGQAWRAGASNPAPLEKARNAWEEAAQALSLAPAGSLARFGDTARAEPGDDAEERLMAALAGGKAEEGIEAFAAWFAARNARSGGDSECLRRDCHCMLSVAAFLADRADGRPGGFSPKADCLDAAPDAPAIFAAAQARLAGIFEDIGRGRGRGLSPQVERAIRYVEKRFSEPVSLEETAEAVRANPAYLSRIFAEETGTPFIEYLTGLRMDYAKRELLRGEKSIKEIAASSGYADPNYFSRIFKKCTGSTPSEFVQANGRLLK